MQIFEMTALDMLNGLVNDPRLHPFFAPGMPLLNMAPFFMKPGNLMFGTHQGVMLFINFGHGVYDAHLVFSPDYPRDDLIPAIRRMISRVFTEHDARAIVASPPSAHRRARVVARATGFAPYGQSTDSLGRPCTNYILERDAWATFSAGLSQESAAISARRQWPTPPKRQQKPH